VLAKTGKHAVLSSFRPHFQLTPPIAPAKTGPHARPRNTKLPRQQTPVTAYAKIGALAKLPSMSTNLPQALRIACAEI
jgi:hypothetical protein